MDRRTQSGWSTISLHLAPLQGNVYGFNGQFPLSTINQEHGTGWRGWKDVHCRTESKGNGFVWKQGRTVPLGHDQLKLCLNLLGLTETQWKYGWKGKARCMESSPPVPAATNMVSSRKQSNKVCNNCCFNNTTCLFSYRRSKSTLPFQHLTNLLPFSPPWFPSAMKITSTVIEILPD